MKLLPRILVVDDEKPMRASICQCLEAEGYRVLEAVDGVQGLDLIAKEKPSLVILDVMMPNLSGLEVAAELRRLGLTIPVLMLTTRQEISEKVEGLGAGADDYLGKPFEPMELVLRIRALLRRAPPTNTGPPAGPVRLGQLEFDPDRGELRDGEAIVRLTGGEAALLTALARKPNEVLSREDIGAALGMDESGERAIDVQVTRLRRKIEADAREPRFLHTVRGRGYVLKPGG